MPLYEYICEACSHEFTELQKFSDKPIKTCPECKQPKVIKKISRSGFALKGSGWYKDGYAKPSSKSETGKSDTTSTAPKPESPTPSKPATNS